MLSNERRTCKRFTLNHPVLMMVDDGEAHLAEIVDAGTSGLRVRLTGQEGLLVGRDVRISCTGTSVAGSARSLLCRVAWEDDDRLEVGLQYMR